MNGLVDFWKAFDTSRPPYIHPDDRALLQPDDFVRSIVDHDTFILSDQYGQQRSKLLHDHLLPSPFAGDLATADIFVLMLNPGFVINEYYGEAQPSFRQRLRKTLHQHLTGEEFPFIWLDPALCFHPGFLFWERKLRDVVKRVGNGVNYLEASKRLSQRMATIELFPYHSQSFDPTLINRHLPSSQAALSFVTQVAGRAKKGKALIIVTRGAATWGLPLGENIVTFSGGHARGAHLTSNTRAGQAMAAFIDRNPR
jgi:hypothetical protein